MTSSPLLTSVAELVVTTRPMFQVGCASACCGVTSASSARLQPRNGPPLAVTMRRATSAAEPPRRHCASAECSESTGTIWPGFASAVTMSPPTMSDSLFASASVLPAASAARVGRRPMEPVMPLSTTSAGRPASSVAASGPTRTSGSGALSASPAAAARVCARAPPTPARPGPVASEAAAASPPERSSPALSWRAAASAARTSSALPSATATTSTPRSTACRARRSS